VHDEQSPAFILAKAGYDVWLANLRGNKYSKRHAEYLATSEDFWDFGWEEHANYDLPAYTEFILKKTGH
jgi:lysosomal acid lipase/cholesteryl ester hydrolase